ncbi:MAG: 5'/3'-nucleotidase SurE [bacterium]
MKKKIILVTNDDGINSDGIKSLAQAMRNIGVVYIVAPDSEQSGVSHSLSLRKPIKIEKTGIRSYQVAGTPTDCVLIAIKKILPSLPSLVVSGINKGPNLGDDVTYSGTVSAAMEGTLFGINSIAFSLASYKDNDFSAASEISASIAKSVINKKFPLNTFLNVNIPGVSLGRIRGIKITHQGDRIYQDYVRNETGKNGKNYYWIESNEPYGEYDNGSDLQAVKDGFISITPLQLDMTNYHGIRQVSSWLEKINLCKL